MEVVNEKLVLGTQWGEEKTGEVFDYDEFGQYLDDIETQLSPRHILDELNETIDSVENELD